MKFSKNLTLINQSLDKMVEETIKDIPKWSLVRIILVPFGLSFKYKMLDRVLSALMVSSLSLFLTFISLSIIRSYENIYETLSKISTFLTLIILLYSFILLKKRIEKFFGMYDDVIEFHTKISIEKRLINPNIIVFIICFILCYVSTIYSLLFSKEIKFLLTPTIMINKILIDLHYPIAELSFMNWIFISQLIIFELCDKYYNVLEFSNNFIEWYLKYESNFEIRYKVLEVIEKFKENENDFKLIVYPMRKLIIMFNLLINFSGIAFILYLMHAKSNNLKTNSSVILFLLFLDIYLIYTQTVIHYKSKVQQKLLTSIKIWTNSNGQNFCGTIHTTQHDNSDLINESSL